MSWFGALENAAGSWLGYGIFILIGIGSLVFGTAMFLIVALYRDFEGAKKIHVLKVLIWGFGGRWRFLTWVWHLDLDLDMVTGLWYRHDPNFGSLSWFGRCKEHPCSLSPHFGLWRLLEFPDRSLASWSWYGYSHLSSTYPWSKFGSLFWFWRCKEHQCPLSPYLGLWKMLEVPDCILASRSWFGYGHWYILHPCSEFGLSILILKVQRTPMSFKSSFGVL